MAIAKAAAATLENELEVFLLELPPFCEKCLAVGNLEKAMSQLLGRLHDFSDMSLKTERSKFRQNGPSNQQRYTPRAKDEAKGLPIFHIA
jgi:hypothetical protein